MSVQRWLLTTEYSHSAVPTHTYHSGVRCGPSWLAVATRHVRCSVRKASSSALPMAVLRARRCSLGNAASDLDRRIPARRVLIVTTTPTLYPGLPTPTFTG